MNLTNETVSVTKLDMDGEDRILAVCERKGREYRIDLLDLEVDDTSIASGKWLAAYRKWAGRV